MIRINELLFQILNYSWILVAIVVFVVLFFVDAPYGRFTRKGWGPMIPNNIGWIAMELPSLVIMVGIVLLSGNPKSGVVYVFISLWAIHYFNRSLIFPFRIKSSGKKMPLSIAGMAVLFNAVNASLNGYYLGYLNFFYPRDWWIDPHFLIGVPLFFTGMYINMSADNHLINLKKAGDYAVPSKGLFRWVTCPNYLGEIIEWLGFAVMVWSLPALSFLVWTVANLVPRALAYRRWYQNKFPGYPAGRKALLPYIL